MQLESLLQYADAFLGVAGHPEYPGAHNGLQVGGKRDVRHVAAAVDASLQTIDLAISKGADLLIVHHGLFWGGSAPLTGRLLSRVRPLIESGTALYACHLPLDSHAEVGNNVLLARALAVEIEGAFSPYQGKMLGVHGRLPTPLDPAALVDEVARAVRSPARSVGTGVPQIQRVGILTGSGASALSQAAALGLDALITGECQHHHAIEAAELGIHLVLAGHYATETFGVKALAAHIGERFNLSWEFLDSPTGL